MAKFRYTGRGTVDANGYHWDSQGVTEVRDDDEATLKKLRGHPSFKEVE